jgi:hypothetical protein
MERSAKHCLTQANHKHDTRAVFDKLGTVFFYYQIVQKGDTLNAAMAVCTVREIIKTAIAKKIRMMVIPAVGRTVGSII